MGHIEVLRELKACSDAVEWVAGMPSPKMAWDQCARGDWLLWLSFRLFGLGRSTVQQKAVWNAKADCAELVLPLYQAKYPLDNRVALCIRGVRQYAAGEIDERQLIFLRENAADAAYAAANAANTAYAAAHAAANAAYAAYAASNAAANAANAADAAYAASNAAAYAAANAAAANAADANAAARDMQARCADTVRARVRWHWISEAVRRFDNG